jgi:dihydroorotase
VVVRGGTVVDARSARRADVAVAGGVVAAVGPDLELPAGAYVLDAGGCVVAPGLVDLHAHLREPGFEEAERVESAARAAALGGYTAVVAMPNTDPPIDCAEVVRDVQALAAGVAVDVAVAGAITVGRRGERLAPMAEMARLGVRLFTDDGAGVQDARLMRRALEYAAGLDATVAEHCEDAALARGGHMHEGEWSSRLGIPGIPAEAEEVMLARDLALARRTGARLHALHVSTEGSVALVRAAKAAGVAVTAEVTPHHLALTDAAVASFDPVFKVSPPLRPQADVQALQAGLADGTLDAVATDHAPHPKEAKELPFDQAPPGMIGLETALAVVLSELEVPLATVLAAMSWRPARIAGLVDHGGPVEPGAPANLCVLDPEATWVVEPGRLASRSRNTPFSGRRLRGKVRHTLHRGEPVVVDGEALR